MGTGNSCRGGPAYDTLKGRDFGPRPRKPPRGDLRPWLTPSPPHSPQATAATSTSRTRWTSRIRRRSRAAACTPRSRRTRPLPETRTAAEVCIPRRGPDRSHIPSPDRSHAHSPDRNHAHIPVTWTDSEVRGRGPATSVFRAHRVRPRSAFNSPYAELRAARTGREYANQLVNMLIGA